MKFLQVGGCVRDAILKRECHDRDWLVIGATPKEMIAEGYTPIGRDFPVFLHPTTHEQYALARTERKCGKGHGGFVFHTAANVTVEEDLKRRDLTINAMAQVPDGETKIIDPYGGKQDIKNKILRHVSAAFSEDPLRVFRVARFAARFHDFTVADETITLMTEMSNSGELTSLSVERVWREFHLGLCEKAPCRMLEVLYDCGALPVFFPEVSFLQKAPPWINHNIKLSGWQYLLKTLDNVAVNCPDPLVRFAVFCHSIDSHSTSANASYDTGNESAGKAAFSLAKRLRAPSEYQNMAKISARWINTLFELSNNPQQINLWWAMFQSIDLWRRPEQWLRLIKVMESVLPVKIANQQKNVTFINRANNMAKLLCQPFTLDERVHDKESREKVLQQRLRLAIQQEYYNLTK